MPTTVLCRVKRYRQPCTFTYLLLDASECCKRRRRKLEAVMAVIGDVHTLRTVLRAPAILNVL